MTWFASIVIALLAGALGLVCGGLVMNACVQWYRVSSFEGKAGYGVVAVALLGGVAGLVIGLVCARLVGAGGVPGFLRGLGCACGSVVALAAIAAGVARVLADVAPTIDGNELLLEVEIRLPVTVTDLPGGNGESRLDLGSVIGGVQRARAEGELLLSEARREDGRWIVPGAVPVFTERGMRSLGIQIDGGETFGFSVPLPRRPDREFEQWSGWYPQPPVGQPPWPDTKASYRFRIAVIEPPPEPPPEPPDPEDLEAERFAALPPTAPLEEWLSFLGVDAPEERVRAVMDVVEQRPAELTALIRSGDGALRERALETVVDLRTVTPEISEAVQAEGRELAEALRAFNELPVDDPEFLQVQVELRSRFGDWKRAWWKTFQQLGLDGRPPVQEMHDLALVRAQGTSMDEIVAGARAILDALESP